MLRLLRFFSRLRYRVFGTKSLRPYEQTCFDGWRNSLSEQARKTLDQQLSLPYFVQRQAGDAKVCFYWFGDNVPLFSRGDFALHVATVVLEAAADKQMNAKIYIHHGRFFSIEFPKRPARYMELHHMTGMPLKLAEVRTHVRL